MRKTKTFVVIGVAAALLVLYAVAGFWLAPRLIRSALLEDIPKSIEVVPSVGEIRVNPFLFQLTVADFSLSGAGGEKLVGFRRLFVDFELSSLWHRAYSFANIDIAAPYVGAIVAKDGTLNLLRLKPKPGPAPARDAPSAPLPSIRIGSFKVSQGVASYEDHTQPDLFAARLEPINFELHDFSTGVEGGRFTFNGATRQGERVEWHGHLSVQPLESDGEFRVDGLLMHTLWDYVQDRVNFVVNSGSVDLAATYRFTAAAPAGADGAPPHPAALHVDLSNLSLKDFAVRPKDEAADWIDVPELRVTGTSVDLASRHAHVDDVTLTGVKVRAWLEPDGSVNLLKLAAPPTAATVPSPAASRPTGATPSPSAAPDASWTYDLREFNVRDADFSLEDRGVHPAAKLVLAPFGLQVNGASQDLGKPVAVRLDTRVNDKGVLHADGNVTPQPMLADVALKLSGVDLAVLQPYIARRTSMTLLGGELGVDAKVHYGTQKKGPTLSFVGRVDVDKLRTVDDRLHDDFISWDHVEIDGMDYAQGPDRLDIDQIVARKLYARVIVEPDSSLNVKRVLTAPGAVPAPAAPAAPATPAAGQGAPQTPQKRVARNAPAVSSPAPASAVMPMSIRKIVLDSSTAQFSDMSVAPNFSAGIRSLGGTIVGLSSNPKSRATMDLHGSLDAFSPVSITGQFNILGPKLFTDVSLSFRNISLPIFNPYSGKFAGYNITEGKLSTELHYKVDGRQLDAQHHVVIEQLEFGDKTASKEAVSLPVKLAVSLLKDRNGVIDLNLPVTGSLDDPQFRLAPLVWKVLVNVLEKAITAPFALLGSLFGGGPDIQFIDFQPGVSALDAAATEKVKTVTKALIERPQLKIEVPIAVVPELDRPALVAAKVAAELNGAQAGIGKGAGGPPPRPFTELEPQAQLRLLTVVYARDVGAEPKYPEAVTAVKGKTELVTAKIDFLTTAIREHATVADADLQALGQQRALALQQALLQGTELDPERVFLAGNDKAAAKDGTVRLELTLK